MQKNVLLGVSVGESFAEYALLLDSKPVAQKRVYISRDNLKQSLQQFVTENSDHKPNHSFISLRLPRKLLDFNLSGAVAHITTEGFEHWLEVCENSPSLTKKDLSFSLRERILADGTIAIPLQLEELDQIVAKLELMECKKVCLHLLHSSMHPTHLNQTKSYLESKGLEVFIPEKSDHPSEVTRWKKNALSATTSSVFEDRKQEIVQALEGVLTDNQIYFLTSDGKVTPSNKSPYMSGLFSGTTAMALQLGTSDKADVLYLGLENFFLISASSWQSTWQSPWGEIEIPHARTLELGIQPTLGIDLNDFGHFDFTQDQESWEPGPMFLGRGQKSTLLDLWAENPKLNKLMGLEERISTPGLQRFKNALFALSKISQSRDKEMSHISKELQSLSLQRLAMEAYLNRKSEKLIVTGPLAALFANAFKKDPRTSVVADEFCEVQAVALNGFKSLGASL